MDLNPLHYINLVNQAIGHSMADVLEFLGITDPAVDPERIREVAAAWKALGATLDDTGWHTSQALAQLNWEGEAAGAFHARAVEVRDRCGQAAGVLHQGSDQLNAFAAQADDLIAQIGVLCAQIVEFEVAALPLSLLTGPISEVASALASGERAAQIVALIARIAEAARTVERAVEAILEALGALGRALRALAPIAKLATGGIAVTFAYDAVTNPGRLRHADTIEQDAAAGALLGILGGAFGKGVQQLLAGLGPRMMPALAGAGLIPDLSVAEDGTSRLGTLMARAKGWLDKLPPETRDRIVGRMKLGRAFNDANNDRYPYSEVRVEPPKGSKLEWAQVDAYNPGKEIISRKDSQLARLAPSTWKGDITEILYKYAPGTKITSRKGDLYGTTLEGRMILEVPVQDAPVPEEIIRFASKRRVIIRDVRGHVYTLKSPGGRT